MANDQQPPQEGVVQAEEAQATSDELKKEDTTQQPPSEENIDEMTTLHERTIAVLSYFGFLAIIPFYLKKESKFCRFHGKQGMTLAIIFFLANFVAVLDFFMDLMLILQAAVALWMGFSALSGRWKKMPMVYDWSCKLEESLSLKTKEEMLNDEALNPDQTSTEEKK